MSLQYLTFALGAETFAIAIRAVKEIIGYSDVSTVPMMPEDVRGVINLRGAVVPVIDLAVRFGRPAAPVGKRTCIVILEGTSGEGIHVFGVVVDAVHEVLEIAEEEVEAPPKFGASIRAELISGMARVNNSFVIVLDIEQLQAVDLPDEQVAPAT